MHLPNNSKQKHSDLQRDRLPYIEKRDRYSDTTTDALHNNGQPLSIVELYGNIYSDSTIALNIILLAHIRIYLNTRVIRSAIRSIMNETCWS